MAMNPRYRHGPILDTQRRRCPVCHQAVYSLAGIHPQCAIKLADSSPPSVPTLAEADAEAPVAITVPEACVPVKGHRVRP
jgi:hypothetical protein